MSSWLLGTFRGRERYCHNQNFYTKRFQSRLFPVSPLPGDPVPVPDREEIPPGGTPTDFPTFTTTNRLIENMIRDVTMV